MREPTPKEVYAKLQPGDVVLVSPTPAWEEEYPAIVLRPKAESVDALIVYAGGWEYRRDTWYHKDPRVKKRAHLFGRRGLYSDRGVFKTTLAWQERKAWGDTICELDEKFVKLVRQVSQLKSVVTKLLKELVAGRGEPAASDNKKPEDSETKAEVASGLAEVAKPDLGAADQSGRAGQEKVLRQNSR